MADAEPGLRPPEVGIDRPDNTQSVVGSEGSPIETDDGVMVSQMRGSEGQPIETDAGRMLAEMVGSEGDVVETVAGRLVAQMIGSEGDPVETNAGRLVSELVGDEGITVEQNSLGQLEAAMVGLQGAPVDQDPNGRLVTAIVGSEGDPITTDAGRLIAQVVGEEGVVSQSPDGRLEAGIFGSGGEEFSQTVTGSLRNNTYQSGAAFDNSSYPFTINPTETIYELTVFSTPAQQTLDITTTGGSTLTNLNPQATNFVISSLEIESVTFNDDGNSENTSGFWAGETA